jgi:serine/threonine protein phosphatase PrpC
MCAGRAAPPVGWVPFLAALFSVGVVLSIVSRRSKSVSLQNNHGFNQYPFNTRRDVTERQSRDEPMFQEGGKLLQCYDFGCLMVPYDYDRDTDGINVIVQQWESMSETKQKGVPEYGMITRRSNDRDINQDRALFIRPFLVGSHSEPSPWQSSSNFLLAVFDGHSELGHEVSSYLLAHFPPLLAANLSNNRNHFPADEDAWIRSQLRNTFLEIQDQIPLSVAYRGGSTGCVVLRIGQRLFVANVGDSQVVLTQHEDHPEVDESGVPDTSLRRRLRHVTKRREPELLFRNELHKPENPQELKRIQEAGGKVTFPQEHGRFPRVVTYCKHAVPPDTIGLAMSRSFGDNDHKGIGVVAEPTIDVINLSLLNRTGNEQGQDDSLLLVAASDGLWDLRSFDHGPIHLAKRFGESWFGDDVTGSPSKRKGKESNPHRTHPLRAIADTIRDFSPRDDGHYRDDITVVAVTVQ